MKSQDKLSKSQKTSDVCRILDFETDTAIKCPDHKSNFGLSELLAAYTAVIYIFCGRGRVGKTFIANLLIKRLRRAGHPVLIVDAEGSNDGLRAFYDEGNGSADKVHHRSEQEETRDFIRRMVDLVTIQRGFAVWDAGGNDRTLDDYAKSSRLRDYLKAKRIAVAVIYTFGDDLSDLSNILTADKDRGYEAQKIILCANAGAPPTKKYGVSGLRHRDPLAEVLSSPALEQLVSGGAGLMTIPRFDFTDQLNALDLDVFDVIDGKSGSTGEPIGPSTQYEIEEWWKEVEAAFAEQEAWLP
ncbi:MULTISPECIES: hypothetical protein [Methylobacterium]|uniref:CobQ/CobB/MinD/ParA nucleotide binding domain-containing protein n=1 Tax=Methylobacterium persicinum TaxID=374426 RepID=A0ABU0HSW7_9HYPH|nr:hypothetical protein [Methylobacterium persicinum]MDQ0445427.1 hypothetical protein [Methylobacterium persicinum]GJE39462.1 hypothetical protein KHHGKMAE_3544 [Methylobacterium persicinum]